MLADIKEGSIPFTYRFLGLRLRLAFTKRRFQRVEASFQNHMMAEDDDTTGLTEIMEDSFSTLRCEIQRIEAGQESMKKKALPKVEELLLLHRSFLEFLRGFHPPSSSVDDGTDDEENRKSYLPCLDRGDETTTAIKQKIAEFAGVPIGSHISDLRSLHTLLIEFEEDQEKSL